ncbi:hypothetical protein K8R42_03655 [bacterium]|nr:hypothetical protein [bacterium]
MNEQFKREAGSEQENEGKRLLAAWSEATEEENQIRAAIGEINETIKNPDEAATIVWDKYADDFETAHAKTRDAVKAYFAHLKEQRLKNEQS